MPSSNLYPDERGLKGFTPAIRFLVTDFVATYTPMKRGLKAGFPKSRHAVTPVVATYTPMKRGLKEAMKDLNTYG